MRPVEEKRFARWSGPRPGSIISFRTGESTSGADHLLPNPPTKRKGSWACRSPFGPRGTSAGQTDEKRMLCMNCRSRGKQTARVRPKDVRGQVCDIGSLRLFENPHRDGKSSSCARMTGSVERRSYTDVGNSNGGVVAHGGACDGCFGSCHGHVLFPLTALGILPPGKLSSASTALLPMDSRAVVFIYSGRSFGNVTSSARF
jgi:hypothetical protein